MHKITLLICIEHTRDVVEQLIKEGVTEAGDFCWTSQMRFQS